MKFRVSGCCFAGLAVALLSGAGPVSAETLQGALAKAYQSNPTLNAARANLLATDENVPIARANGLPSATLNSTYNENVLIPPGQFIVTPRTLGTRSLAGSLTSV